MASGKKSATIPGTPTKKTSTVTQPVGTVSQVTNPLDLWYLCEKVNYALKFPKISSDGAVLYQRVVTRLIRFDDKNFDFHFPYIGEVGYNMTQNPPGPIMSQRKPNWPSSFPLSKFWAIKKGYDFRMRGLGISDVVVERISELMTRNELENILGPEMRNQPGKAKSVPNELDRFLKGRRGLFRIPDVIRINNTMLTGKQAFTQQNIHTVIEIKFPGDRLSPEQQVAYQRIAGDRQKFRLLETKVCQIDDKRKREWIRDAKKEPVYLPVGLAGHKPLPQGREPYPLLEGEIQREFEAVQQYFAPFIPANYDMPRLEPMPDPALLAMQQQQLEQARGQLGMAVGGPFFAISGGIVLGTGVGALPALGFGGRELLGKSGDQVIRYATSLLAGGGSVRYATANQDEQVSAKSQPKYPEDGSSEFLNDVAKTQQEYVYWPD